VTYLRSLLPLLLFSLFLNGCNDKAIVNTYDKTISQKPIKCLKLTMHPGQAALEKTMRDLYRFDPSCPLRLEISYKNGITCNSTHNIQSKAVNGFPSSYLTMEIRKGLSLKYSYYIDLDEAVTPEDLRRGFDRIREDLRLEPKICNRNILG
jgi:hypothetical protein